MAFTIIREDLARVAADAIVVPSNTRLSPDGGVAYAVAQAAGYRRVRRACKRLGGCSVGKAAATPAFDLPAQHIIHAVGPVWHGGDEGEAALLRSAYDSALELALRLNARSVALPLLSAGIYGYPVREAFEIAVEAIRAFLETADMDVLLVLFDKRAVTEGSRLVGEVREYIDDAYAADHAAASRRREDLWRYDSVALGAAAEETAEVARAATGGDFCQVCGAPLRPESRFCVHCGAEVSHGLDAREGDFGAMEASPRFGADSPVISAGVDVVSPWEFAQAAPQAREPLPKAGARPSFPHLPTLERPSATGGFAAAPAAPPEAAPDSDEPDLRALLAHMDDSFSTMLMKLIDARGLADAQVYKRANISRQHFSKMRNPDYRPTKKTVVALAVALELSLADTRDLLARAGFALSHSSKFDIIVEYFIGRGHYDIFDINEVLFAYDQPLLE